MLQLYFRPMACSLASRMALMEAGLEARYHSVELRTKRILEDDGDFRLGADPFLRLASGQKQRVVRPTGKPLGKRCALMTPDVVGSHHEHFAGLGRKILSDAAEDPALHDRAITLLWCLDLERRQAPSVHPAHAGVAAHAARAGRRFRACRCPIGVRREGGILLAQMLLPAGGTIHIRRLSRAPDQLFKFGVAILTLIFVDRHSCFNLNPARAGC